MIGTRVKFVRPVAQCEHHLKGKTGVIKKILHFEKLEAAGIDYPKFVIKFPGEYNTYILSAYEILRIAK